MELRTVGKSGLSVSAIGLGCNNFGMRIGPDESREVVRAALDGGITLFDTADIYGGSQSEEFLGAALGADRADVAIATKFGGAPSGGALPHGGSRSHVLRCCEASLRRLGTDYIDLYYQHYHDPLTPVDETLSAVNDLVRQGKVRYAGCSNFAGWQVAQADHAARQAGYERYVANQVEWNLLRREVEREVVPACAAYGLAVMPYFPLASGLLAGKYRRGEPPQPGSRFDAIPFFAQSLTDQAFDVVERLTAVGDGLGHSLLELAIGWLLGQDAVASVLIGATSARQVKENLAAAQWRPSAADLAAVTEAAAAAVSV
jgi:aryl-alcohol dehydrogenase-like predicted oxidoreductase